MKSEGFFRISSFASEVMEKNAVAYKRYQVLKDWSHVVGERIAKFSSIAKYEKSVIYVSSSDPLWLSEIHLSRDAILEKYKKLYPELSFNDLRVLLDKRKFKDKDVQNIKKMIDEEQKKFRDSRKNRLDEIIPPSDFKIGFLDFID